MKLKKLALAAAAGTALFAAAPAFAHDYYSGPAYGYAPYYGYANYGYATAAVTGWGGGRFGPSPNASSGQ